MRNKGLESGIWNLESGIWNLESGIWNLESGIWNLERRRVGSRLDQPSDPPGDQGGVSRQWRK